MEEGPETTHNYAVRRQAGRLKERVSFIHLSHSLTQLLFHRFNIRHTVYLDRVGSVWLQASSCYCQSSISPSQASSHLLLAALLHQICRSWSHHHDWQRLGYREL